MKVKVGDTISSEFGTGEIVCITDFWLVHKTEQGEEVAVPYKVDSVWIPVSGFEPGCNSTVKEIIVPGRS